MAVAVFLDTLEEALAEKFFWAFVWIEVNNDEVAVSLKSCQWLSAIEDLNSSYGTRTFPKHIQIPIFA